ncbi:uncharacterized protein LOC126849328 [Cataglyphis hispanica]|uniref:uncharacterized protein LOC126849328 n=1 Tax=Cataglyphis hispanica TaxID=1086592 RepID=UPI00218075A3|nr:uncharacterized protein LOC126849328 [Cataglyphis hispanica]
MIITRSAVTAAATVTRTTTTTARWALLLKRDTHCRYYDNVDGQRRSTTTALRSDAVSAMLSRDRGRRALHRNDSSNSTDRIHSSGSTVIALALPYYYYHYYYRYYCKYVAALLVDDENNLVIARIPPRRNDADNSEALVTANSDDHLLNRQNGLRCCA